MQHLQQFIQVFAQQSYNYVVALSFVQMSITVGMQHSQRSNTASAAKLSWLSFK